RTRRRAERLVAAGAAVEPLSRLLDLVATADVVLFGTAAPEPLLEAAPLAAVPRRPVLVLDLCVPRNVDPDVRAVGGVRLLDLADLRSARTVPDEAVTRDVAVAEQVVAEELARYAQWLARRTAASSVQRLRTDVEACVRSQVEETVSLSEDAVRRVVQQVAHGPTRRLLEAAEAGDERLVDVLAGLFAPAG
ncbi:MAG: hypothetical protein HOQ22_07625, partial [Nocardioidaceae bacterium]|nr:hypothetical protein [Nocardioidaceae bacterium]